IDRKLINKELLESKLLGETKDGKKIILTDFNKSPNVMNEIARLREVTFRSIGEGTGKKMDFDEFDKYYSHLVVWDENELEIVGSYRIGFGKNIYEEIGLKGFYTSTLFNYSENFVAKIITNSIELGRSFVQKKYWNSNALDYLWQGIGALIASNPDIKYLFGAVSISNSYSAPAKNRLVYYYNKWFGSVNNLAHSKNRFVIPKNEIEGLQTEFNGENFKSDFRILKKMLKQFGFSVPVLYKHYSELCEQDGVKFLDFGVDADFENCIDGLLVVDLEKIKAEKKERYINQFIISDF
ncbi:MAG: GNAT family N-acetyltransferase, partial [Ignavibacteria bacterium]|nr:GNAT family N-acetyltransferase [Ignavibacteria bacterium]